MRRVHDLNVTALMTAALLFAHTVHATCTSGSVPGRLACNMGDAFVTSAGRRADEVNSRAVVRASAEALEHARVHAAATELRTATRQSSDMVRAAQQAAPRAQPAGPSRAQRDAAERLQEGAERTQREAQQGMQREAQQQAKAVQQTTASPSTSAATADPGTVLTSVQRLKNAHTTDLPTRVKGDLGVAIRHAEEVAATAHTQQQRKLAQAQLHEQTQRNKVVLQERPQHNQRVLDHDRQQAQAKTAQQHREAQQAQNQTRADQRAAETTLAPQRQADKLRLAEAKLVDSQELAGRQAAPRQALNEAVPLGGTNRLRHQPGVATYNGQLPHVTDPHWMLGKNSALLPAQVAERLAGKNFRNFGELRTAVWREIANDATLRQTFQRTPSDLTAMYAGRAPSATPLQRRGGRVKYELDHAHELQDGGGVYSLQNLRIKTPDAHVKKLARKLNVASGAHEGS